MKFGNTSTPLMADGLGTGDWPAWLALLTSAVSALWQIRSNQLSKKDRISLIRKVRIEALAKDMEEISALATNYWTKKGTDSYVDGFSLNLKIKDISTRTWEYKDFLWPDVTTDFTKIKMLITGGQFQVHSRPALLINDPLFRQIGDLLSGFKIKLRVAGDKQDGL